MCFKKYENQKLKRQPIFENPDQKHFIKWNSVLHICFLFYYLWDITEQFNSKERKKQARSVRFDLIWIQQNLRNEIPVFSSLFYDKFVFTANNCAN